MVRKEGSAVTTFSRRLLDWKNLLERAVWVTKTLQHGLEL